MDEIRVVVDGPNDHDHGDDDNDNDDSISSGLRRRRSTAGDAKLEDVVGGNSGDENEPINESDDDLDDDDDDEVELVDEEDLHVSEVEVRDRRWYEMLFALRWPFTYVIMGLSALIAAVLGGALALSLTLFPDSDLHGERWSTWFTFALTVLGVYVGLSMFVGCVIFVLGSRYVRTKTYYFAAGLRNASVVFGWGIVGIIVGAIFMSDLDDEWGDGLDKFFVSVAVVSGCYGVRVVAEKFMILRLSINMHRRVSESIFQEKVLFKLLSAIERAHSGAGAGAGAHRKSLRRATMSGVRRARKVISAGAAAKKLLVNESLHALNDARGNVRSHRAMLDGDDAALSHMQKSNVMRGWSPVCERDPVKVEGKVPLSAQPLLEEKQRKREEQQAKLIGTLVYEFLDSTRRGHVVEDDFRAIYPDRAYYRQQAFFAFNPQLLKAVSRDDVRDTVQRIYRQREAIRRGLSDRADVSAIVRKLAGGVFWTLMFVVVLIIFGVDVVAVVLPYVSLMLAFSFAFGPTVRVLLESAILVLVIAPYDVGDRVICAGSNGIIIIDRITLFTTYAHSPAGEGYALPNAAIYRGVIRNHHRSLPFGLFADVDVVASTPASALVELIQNAKQYCADSDIFVPNPSAWIDDIDKSNAIRVRFQVMTRSTAWNQVPKVRRALSLFHQFIASQLEHLQLKFRLPDQPIILDHQSA
jgi:small-conductance mechanosensitive channel